MTTVIAVLATLDTKGAEALFIKDQLEQLGSKAFLIDIGVLGHPDHVADVTREAVAEAGGTPLPDLLRDPSREAAAPVMAAGATRLVENLVKAGKIDGVIGLGGLQGTAACTQVMRALPYGLPKVMVSTVASGDTSAYVDTKDITMMFSVGDILGLNTFTRKILANAAGAAHGMAQVAVRIEHTGDKPLVGMTNLGVLTKGAMQAIEFFAEQGYEVIVFHAIGSGGRAMEHMMRDGIIGAVFDYALGEISDEVFRCLRAGGPDRLHAAGELGIPQVLCPGGTEHLGIYLDPPNVVPDGYRDHIHVFHSPVVLAPRLKPGEMVTVAREIGARLAHTKGNAVMMIPTDGLSRYSAPGGPLRDTEGDAVFVDELCAALPDSIEVVKRDTHAEDPAFVKECVDRLIALIEHE